MSRSYVVVKCGGATVDTLSDQFYERMAHLREQGKTPVIVHGGGAAVNEMLETMQVETTFVNGLRRTTREVLNVADMVFNGKVNPMICAKLQAAGLNSVGLSGCDGPMIEAKLLDEKKLGLVGEAVQVNPTLIQQVTAIGLTPVISPLVAGKNGMRLNMNADTAAAHYAQALEAEEVMFVTDVPGILQDGEPLDYISEEEVNDMIAKGTIYGGMIPKVEAAIQSLKGSVKKVTIIGGEGEGGTTIVKAMAGEKDGDTHVSHI
ncbi:acetylglutamate kinase [Natribacillus halophilus]|uniref:Acetylglutamate kinase n=1 Tax=Natribacillus halophilus TaxID=549003 RepID=A0A1G8LGX5_9BACI|nr:acetylglutamate kinase [Natribacillus halophilus]SDI54936.1 N-acetylglutamate kinase [Natribacillus halophilus]